uniref:NADH-ubiquinone oxidoreductase chain 3 n=1 Tax=Entoria okinawaensis TaxID=590984 RepID=E2RUP8_9NEOP|nr:NADH dehydrogenase subunit 3 [Entoria okinawaensis]BAJ24432.1 NADH dehydrogenase subunit 3 [Entoria okinawaensis]
MILVLMMTIMTLVITNLVMFINLMLYKKSLMDREKITPFECGFDPKSSPRMPFSLKFFLIAVIFLIFDIEIALLLPMMPTMISSNMMQWMTTIITFIIILIMGLYHEWNQGALNWV